MSDKATFATGWIKKTILESGIEVIDGDRGVNYPKETEFEAEGACLFLNAKNVTPNGFKFRECQFINKEKDALLGTGKLNINDIVITTRGTVGNIAFLVSTVPFKDIRINSGMAILRNSNQRIDNKYLYALLRSPLIKRQILKIAFGSAQPQLTIKIINDISIAFPPPPHQRKIGRILTTVDNIIEKTESAIEKYKAIKQGMMHDLFTRGIDVKTGKLRPSYEEAPELYKETELGMIPKDWKLDKLENVTHYVDYRGKTPPKSETGIFLITAKNIKDGFIDYEISREYIRIHAFESTMSRGKAYIGDVVITTEAPLGNVAQIDFEGMALAQRVIKYRGEANVLMNDFLKQSLMSDYFQKLIHSESTGSTVKGIKGSRLHKQPLLIPEIGEQEAISITILQQEAIISSEQQYLNKQQKFKQGLMQDLITGKKEVTPDPEDFNRE